MARGSCGDSPRDAAREARKNRSMGRMLAWGGIGVVVAVGNAVRNSIVVFTVLDNLLTLAIWGTTTSVRIAG